MRCEVCGCETSKTFKVEMEGSIVETCKSCKNLGNEVDTGKKSSSVKYAGSKTKSSSSKSSIKKKRKSFLEDMGSIVEDYAERIRKGRERKELTQNELAEKVGEKRSLIRNLENGKKLPEEEVAKKLEKVLGIELRGEEVEIDFNPDSGGEDITFGDVVRIKKKDS